MNNRTNSENFLKKKRDILLNKEKMKSYILSDKVKFPLCVCVCELMLLLKLQIILWEDTFE